MMASSGATRLPRTHTEQVLDYLRTRGPLTQPEALEELGCLRLGARIWDLKQLGHAIKTEFVELASGQRVARYALVREAQQRAPRGGDAGMNERTRTLNDVLSTLGELTSERGGPPTVREFQAALGIASEAAMQRWLRVLEREGYLTPDSSGGRRGASGVRSLRLAAAGSDRLYALERQRRIEAEKRGETPEEAKAEEDGETTRGAVA